MRRPQRSELAHALGGMGLGQSLPPSGYRRSSGCVPEISTQRTWPQVREADSEWFGLDPSY
jgi:hypothetical protein